MDITLARTFLRVVETGSFIDAARRLNITQSTVSTRIKSLEDQLGRPLFERSKSGAELTAAGEQFQKHALALLRVWQQAQREVGLTDAHRDHLTVGADTCLWSGLLLKWIAWLRTAIPDIAVTGANPGNGDLVRRLVEGTLDLAVLYRPAPIPGLAMEHLFDEEFVLATTAPPGRRAAGDHVLIDWGTDFQSDRAALSPEFASSGLNLDLGPLGLDYVLENGGSAYFPVRLIRRHVARGRLRIPARSRRFTYPVFVVYPEARDEEAYAPLLEGLRRIASREVPAR